MGFFKGDGATISRFPLLNILASAKNIPVAVLENFDCQVHLARGYKKDATFICNQFLKDMKEIYPVKNLTGVIMFDGVSNVQLGGKLLKVHYPKLTVMYGVEHTVLLFLMMFQRYPLSFK